jgi:hypothetical protein
MSARFDSSRRSFVMAAASTAAAPVVARTLIADARKETKGLGDPATVTLNVNDREHRVPPRPSRHLA